MSVPALTVCSSPQVPRMIETGVQNAQVHQKVSHGQDTLCVFILIDNAFRDVFPVSTQGCVHSLAHFIVIPVLHSWKPQTVIGVTLGVAV